MVSLTPFSSPGFFITSFISVPVPTTQAAKPITSQVEGEGLGMHSPRPLSPGQYTSNSLIVQPPSAPGQQVKKEITARPADGIEDFEEQRFDNALASIYASTPQDPLSYIREEKLDDKEIMLMDGKLGITFSFERRHCILRTFCFGAYADFLQ